MVEPVGTEFATRSSRGRTRTPTTTRSSASWTARAFSPEQQEKLAQIATKAGTVLDRVVTNVVVRYLDEEARFLAAVEQGPAAAARGEFIDEAAMDARLEAMFKA